MSDDPNQYLDCPECESPLHPGEPCVCVGGRAGDGDYCLCEGGHVLFYESSKELRCPECGWGSTVSVDGIDCVAYAVRTTCRHGKTEDEPCPECEEEQ